MLDANRLGLRSVLDDHNLNYLQNLVWLPLLILYAYFSAQICFTNKHRLLGILIGAVPIVWLILMRQLAYFSDFGYVYPVFYHPGPRGGFCRLAPVGDHRRQELP